MNLLPPILLIDGNPNERALVSLVLRGEFGEVDIEQVGDAAALTGALAGARFGLVLTEYGVAGIDGAELIELLRNRLPAAALVVVSDVEPTVVAGDVIVAGVDGFAAKTHAGLAELGTVVRGALLRCRRRGSSDDGMRQLVDGLPVGVFITDGHGVILDANPALATLLGFRRPAELVNRRFHSFLVGSSAAQDFEAAVHGDPSVMELDAEIEGRGGGRAWVRINLWPAASPAGTPRRFHGLVENTGPFRTALAELQGRSGELERSNRDLEEMAYVVSHDLQQPLGVIMRSLELLEDEAVAGGMGGEGSDLLAHARRGAAALERMLTAIVGYARVDTRGAEFSSTDLRRVVDRALDLLEDEITATSAQITIDPLPTVLGDEAQLEQLFLNLLSNAIKFRGAAAPRVHIGVTEREQTWHLTVRDHGIGIDPNALDRVFQMFQRLHTDEEIPGTGIGLAVCRRIVTRHGGKIWVEARPGGGATFHITLPRQREVRE